MTASLGEVITVALRLGLTSFGGPIAHLGYFRAGHMHRRRCSRPERRPLSH